MKILCFSSLFLLGTVGAGSVRRQDDGNSTSSPCAIVSQSSAVAVATSPGVTPTVSAQLAYDCLSSVPLDASAATDLVKSILPYVEWQSDISYLKDPPSGYQVPRVDLQATFNGILEKLETGGYLNEYQFQADLYKTFNLAHDGHFRFAPDLISKAVGFRRPVQLVSVSRDGVEIPKIYVRDDMANFNNNDTSTVSAMAKINDENVDDFLNNLALNGFLQDLDALYNNLFFELAMDAQFQDARYTGYFAGAGRFGNIYTGAETKLEFENGTIATFQNYADVFGDFHGVVNGTTFYQRFCTGPNGGLTSDDDDDEDIFSRATTPAHGYPTPIVISSDQQISGYFLDDNSTYADVAVLSVLSFEPNFPEEFQATIETFISNARAAGKTKVIIDLSGNGGGIILTGYDAFRQFFPQIVQDGFSRFREHEAFMIMSQRISNFTADFSAETASSQEIFASQSILDYRYDLNQTNQNFLTYGDKFDPRDLNGDKFTNILRWNLSDPLLTTNLTWGLGETITGYGDRQNFTQPFAAEDIIMVFDGYCASTCGIFSEFMRVQGGVKSIALGGRPNNFPIQAIGGTKGTNNYPFGYILALANVALDGASSDELANLTAVTALTSLPIIRSTDSSINVRDNILRDNLEDGTPAQFLYEDADCRLFYEPEMLKDPRAIWKKAAAVAWGGGNCVAGSLSQKNETQGERRRKSEEMKMRARSDKRATVLKSRKSFVKGSKSPIHGQKVPI